MEEFKNEIEFWEKDIAYKPWVKLGESLENFKKAIISLNDERALDSAIEVLHNFLLDMDFCFISTFGASFSENEKVKEKINKIKEGYEKLNNLKVTGQLDANKKFDIIREIQKNLIQIYYTSAEFHKKFDVHLPFTKKESWELTTLDRLQINPDEKILKKINEKKKRRQRLAMIIALDLVTNNQDHQIVVAGENGMGKSTTAIWLAREIKKYIKELYLDPDFRPYFERPDKKKFVNEKEILRNFSINEDIIYRRNPTNLKKLYNYPQFGIKVIDEGYFFALNVETMSKPVVDLIKIMNMSRDRNGCIIWAFKKVLRATPALRERFTMLIYKVKKPYGALILPSRMVVSADKFGVGVLEKEASRGEFWFKLALKKLPWYITAIRFPALKGRGWNKYETLKRKAEQEEVESIVEGKKIYDPFLEEIRTKIEKYGFKWEQIAEQLRELKFTDEEIERVKKNYVNYIFMKKQQMAEKKIKELKDLQGNVESSL